MTTLVLTTPNTRKVTAGAPDRVPPRLRTTPPVTTEQLLRDRSRLPCGDPDRALLRIRAIEDNLPLAKRLAGRYAGRGESFDDLAQVAALALVKAVDGYSPDRALPFAGYAVPTILGELKRHFRDRAWGMRVPRSTQELLLELPAATSHLTHLRGRTPTTAELADHLRVTSDVLLAATNTSQVYRLPSLNATTTGDEHVELTDLVGGVDPGYGRIDDRMEIRSLIAALPPRERRILTMRFYHQMTQDRIAAEIGVSQMHVSRLLCKTLTELRLGFPAGADHAPTEGPTNPGTA